MIAVWPTMRTICRTALDVGRSGVSLYFHHTYNGCTNIGCHDVRDHDEGDVTGAARKLQLLGRVAASVLAFASTDTPPFWL
jgi:hypothetical protein